jgi:hypothetical protein
MNVNIPIQYAYVYGIDGTDKIYECVIHAARSRAGKVMTFHVHLKSGAQYSLVPLHKIIHKEDVRLFEDYPQIPLQSWDCFSDHVECHVYSQFQFKQVAHKYWGLGEYICTFDWFDNDYSDMAEEFKQGHFIRLESGNYGIFPNNELLFHDKTWTGGVMWGKHIPKLRRQEDKDYQSCEKM